MAVLILGERDVFDLLPMAECIGVMERLFSALIRNPGAQPPRIIAWQNDRLGAIAAMPGWLSQPPTLGAKLISVFPQNRAIGMESHQGIVALYDTNDGHLFALMHAGAITAIRTAAVSGLATKILANEGPADLALLGSGTQARMHLEAMLAVRPVRRVRVWSRTSEHAQTFVREMRAAHDVEIEAVASPQLAVESAALICTTTAATQPVLLGAWLRDGAHVNAAGASVPGFRELDSQAIVRARLFADNRENVLREADDVRIPIAEQRITPAHIIADLAQLTSGGVRGRSAESDVTVFESVGMALEDLAAANYLYERAVAENRGTSIAF
jgi:ornithine cyclodeaminase